MTNVIEYLPGLYLTELRLDELDMDVRGAVVVGREAVVVWDTLTHPRDMAPVRPLLAGRPLIAVYSHADWDHAWGTNGLPAEAVVAGQAACRERFAAEVPEKLHRMQADQPGRWDEVHLVAPAVVFQDDLTLALGGLTLHLYHLPGHTEDCIAGWIPELGVWLGGDTVEDPFPLLNKGTRLQPWITRLAAWAADERVKTVIPAHGPVGDRSLIQRNIAYLEGLRTGNTPLPAGLPDFYREAHAANLRYAREAG